LFFFFLHDFQQLGHFPGIVLECTAGGIRVALTRLDQPRLLLEPRPVALGGDVPVPDGLALRARGAEARDASTITLDAVAGQQLSGKRRLLVGLLLGGLCCVADFLGGLSL